MADFFDVNPDFHRPLFSITDRLRRLKTNPDQLTVEDYCTTLAEVCGSLTTSLDNGLKEIVGVAIRMSNRPENKRRARNIITDVGTFAEFIHFEKTSLQQCGISPESIESITREIAGLKDELGRVLSDNPEEDLDPDHIVKTLEEARDSACLAAAEAIASLSKQQKRYGLKRVISFITGSTVTIANAISVAATGGATLPFALLSTTSGGIIIASKEFYEDPSKRKPK